MQRLYDVRIKEVKRMFLLVNKYVFGRRFVGVAVWPFIIIKYKKLKDDTIFMNHERIHLRQQLELLILPFYIIYMIEFLLRLLQYRDRYTAYRNISFEREAYENEKNIDYIKERSFWAFRNYIIER